MATTSTKSKTQEQEEVKEGVSWGVGGAVPATSGAIGSESSPIPQGTSSFLAPETGQGAGSKSLPGAPRGGGGGTDGYVQAPPQQGSSLRDGINYRIVGFKKLRQLLQPKHPYFETAWAWVKEFSYYSDGNSHFCYPRVKSHSRNNPYRKSQLRSKHTARTIKKLLALRESAELDDFKVAIVVFTFPKEVSEWLCQQGGDREMSWRLFKRFWNEDFLTLDDESDGQAAYVNLHKWKTEEPVKPHYHFHCVVPNYRLVENGDIQDDEGNNAQEFREKPWHRQRGGRLVPFSDEALDLIKRRWHSRLVAFARRHSLAGSWMDNYQGIDVFVEYITWDSDIGKAKLMNKLGYQSRHWLEDYAEYSNKHPDCELPPGWLESYDNKARVFGWWAGLRSLTAGVEMEDKEKLSPIDGEPLAFVSTVSLEGLLHLSKGKLGYLEFYKGEPIEGELTPDDIAWLRSVMWERSPPGD